MAMDPKTVELRALRAHQSQLVMLTFTNSSQSILGLYHLNCMCECGEITIAKRGDEGAVLAILSDPSNGWGRPENCRVGVYFQPSCDASGFGDRIGHHLEQMEVSTPHAVKSIMTSRQQKRLEAVDAIIVAVLTDKLKKKAECWDVRVSGELDTSQPGFSAITFTISTNQAIVRTVVLDGWSGRVFVDDKGGDEMVTDLATVTALLIQEIDAYVERAAA